MTDATEPQPVTLSGFAGIARAVVDGGAKFVASYPGGPATKVVDALIELSASRDIYVEWANCEKVAFEEVLGCSLAGVRTAMLAKHVGINHIMDPLMTANLTGIGGGMLILAGDDPGAYGSQNEQDSRLLGRYAEIPILEPATPEQGYRMTRQAFRLSEAIRLPVMVRFVADYTTESGPVTFEPPDQTTGAEFDRGIRWKALPATAVADHAALHAKLRRLSQALEEPAYRSMNRCTLAGPTGFIAAGHVAAGLRACDPPADVSILELGTLFPLPEELVVGFLGKLDRAYVLEEVEPYVEDQVRVLAQKHRLNVDIYGKTTGHVPWEGDLHIGKIEGVLAEALGRETERRTVPTRSYPSRQPLGDGCPYAPFFTTLKQMIAEQRLPRPIVVGETGCLVRLNNPPLAMLDVKYSMGSSIGIASGLWRSGTAQKILAVTGDSVFFHTAVNGLINAAHHEADIIVAVMDNGTVALTGFQDRIGAGTTAMGEGVGRIYPEKLAEALNIGYVRVLDAFDETAIAEALLDVFGRRGPSVLVVRGDCPYTEAGKCQVTKI
jgi:indolepyruvate ferredoxin oxidoreductase alpha subunit